MFRFVFLALSIAFLLPGAVFSSDYPPFVVERSTSFHYRAVEDDHGGFYITWTHLSSGTYTLMGQHIRPDGTLYWGDAGAVLVKHLSQPDLWDAFADSKGGLLLLWKETSGLRVQRVGPDLLPTDGEIKSTQISTGVCISPTGVADGAGGAYLVWAEKRYPSRSVLVAQHIDASGALLWEAGGLRVSLRPSEQKNPIVVYDGQAGAIVGWKDFREDASQLQIQRLDYQGTRMWGLQGIPVTAPAWTGYEKSLLQPLGDGGAGIAWMGSESGANRLFFKTFDAKGQMANTPLPSVLPANQSQWDPVLYGDGRGTVWAGWSDYRTPPRWRVFVKKIHESGSDSVSGDDIPLGLGIGDEGHVALADDGRGGLFGVWQENRSGNTGIYVQEISSQSIPLLPETAQQVLGPLVNPSPPRIITLAASQAVICVADRQKKSQWALYWVRVEGP